MVEDLRGTISEQKVFCAQCSTAVKSAMENLNKEVGSLNKSLTDGNGGRSLNSRIAVIEDKVARIEKANQLRIAHMITLACALLGSVTAIVIAFLK